MRNRILVGVDGSPPARRALKTAVQIARGLDGELLIVSAYEPTPEAELKTQRLLAPRDVSHLLQPTAEVEQILEDARRIAGADGLTAECFARVGPPADVVVDLAAEREASLIVVGNRGMRGNQLFRTCAPYYGLFGLVPGPQASPGLNVRGSRPSLTSWPKDCETPPGPFGAIVGSRLSGLSSSRRA